MARIIDDCIVETTTTTGTGALTLAGAVTGFDTFASACSVGDKVYYLIEAVDGSGNRTGAWETGFGTYSSAGVLTRTTVHKSSNADAAVNLSAGTKRVMISLTAAAMTHKGALVRKAANLAAQNYTTASALTWDTTVRDTHDFHDPGVNPSRITIPVGLTKLIRLKAQVTFANLTADNWVLLSIYEGGATGWVGQGITHTETGQTGPSYGVETAIIAPADGQYYELFVQTESDTSVDVVAATTYFQLEVVD